jgi:hypothetical protein
MNVLDPLMSKTGWGIFIMGLLWCPGGRPAIYETRQQARDTIRMMRNQSILRPTVKKCRLSVEVLPKGGAND